MRDDESHDAANARAFGPLINFTFTISCDYWLQSVVINVIAYRNIYN